MTKHKLTYLLFLAVLTIIGSACSRNDVLSRDKMVEVLCDIQLAEAAMRTNYNDFKYKEQKEALIRGILDKHNITQAQLDSSLAWYSDNVDTYNRVTDSVIVRLRKENERLSKELSVRMSHKIVNFDILPRFSYLTAGDPLLSFSIDTSRIKKFPDLKLDFKTMWTDKDTDADILVAFQYKDTVISEHLRLDKDTLYTISKPNIRRILESVSGYIYLNTQQRAGQKILIYDMVVTDSDRKTESSEMEGEQWGAGGMSTSPM